MKSGSTELLTYLQNTNKPTHFDVYTLTLISGLVYYYTDADVDLYYNGITYRSNTVRWERTDTEASVGITVDEMTCNVTFSDTDALGALYWKDSVRMGWLDGATLSVYKAFLDSGTLQVVGLVHIFEGNVADSSGGEGSVELTIKNEFEKLNTKIPRPLYQTACRNRLYDTTTCGVVKSAYTTTHTVGVVVGKGAFSASTGKPAGWFDGGAVTFATGLNAGLSMTVKSFDGSNFVLVAPMLLTINPNDTFNAYAGCDRTRATCANKFNNSLNYRGETYTPKPEAML